MIDLSKAKPGDTLKLRCGGVVGLASYGTI